MNLADNLFLEVVRSQAGESTELPAASIGATALRIFFMRKRPRQGFQVLNTRKLMVNNLPQVKSGDWGNFGDYRIAT